MPDYIFLMHSDAPELSDGAAWGPYIEALAAKGVFQGGSEIGEGACFRKAGEAGSISDQLSGFIRIEAPDLQAAAALLPGNPAYEAGGTIEIRELPRTED